MNKLGRREMVEGLHRQPNRRRTTQDFQDFQDFLGLRALGTQVGKKYALH